MKNKEPIFDATKFEDDNAEVRQVNNNSQNKPMLKQSDINNNNNKQSSVLNKKDNNTSAANPFNLKQQVLSKLNIIGIFLLTLVALALMFFRFYIVAVVCIVFAYIWFRVFAFWINKSKGNDKNNEDKRNK